MSKSKGTRQNPKKPLLDELERIKIGELNPKSFSKAYRQRFVELLYFEAQPIPNIAKLLKYCDRTIERDIKDIRARNAKAPDLLLAKEIIGEFMINTRHHKAYLMRLARSKDASVTERTNAESQAARVENDAIARLQLLGYLPLKSQGVVGDIFYHNAELPPIIPPEIIVQLVSAQGEHPIEGGGVNPEST